jgi:hypothetical protein
VNRGAVDGGKLSNDRVLCEMVRDHGLALVVQYGRSPLLVDDVNYGMVLTLMKSTICRRR